MSKKVVLGMSGGVDSSVAAYILKEQGYEVIGITFLQIPGDEFISETAEYINNPTVRDAKKIAKDLNIKHYVVNFKDDFREKVIEYFVEEYAAGRTPNPCLICNKHIKFGKLLDVCNKLGAQYVATGHYAKIDYDEESGRYLLKRSSDLNKDQTYFLQQMNQEQLSRTLFPLEKYKKDEIREIAKKMGMVIHDKPDSEEICFIPDNDHGGFIKKNYPEKIIPGNFIDEEGNILGKHKGIVYYTIGQRKGLGIALGRKVFVKNINPITNEVTLSDNSKLYKSKLIANNLNLISVDKLEKKIKVSTKIRHTMYEASAEISQIDDDEILVEFDEAQRAIAIGQGVIFYDGDTVLGGGIIKEAL